jgi:hypothetical protein
MKTYYFINLSTKKLFFYILIIPILIQLVLINIIEAINSRSLYYIMFIFFWMFYLPFFYWLNNAITFLFQYSIKYYNINLMKFKFSLIVNIITLLNFVFFVAYVFSFVYNGGQPNIDFFFVFGGIQFIGIISFLHSSIIVCKTIKTIELKRKVHFNDIYRDIIYYSFPPLTIWVIHNKIKELYHNNKYPNKK